MTFSLVVSLVALGLVWRLSMRVRTLEARLAAMSAALAGGATPADETTGQSDIQTAPQVPPIAAPNTPDQSAPDPEAAPGPASRPAATAWGRAGQGGDGASQLALWLRGNWIYPAAGIALMLSGVFLVQYAVETGLLTPQARVILALILGGALVAAGEWLRRRPAAGPVLPAVLAGSGLVIAMAAVLAALHLYAMIPPGVALAALAVLSFGAVALGWVHGPMLSALGLVAGSVVPFVLGGGGPPPAALFGYFALLALAGLGIDAARRWGWVTWLALAGPLTGAVLWRLAGGDATAFALALVVVAGAAMTLPFGRVMPLVEGPRALSPGARPQPGVRASLAASVVAALGAALMVPGWSGPLAIVALALLIAVWARRAPALADQMVLPVLALPAWIVWQDWTRGPLLDVFLLPRLPESEIPVQASLLVLLAMAGALAMLWRGEAEDPGRHAPWTLAGLALPGGTLAALETTWTPAASVGPYGWALQIMALAALATLLALRYGARDAGQGPRLGAAAATAFALVALALTVMLGLAALTLALAVLMIAAAAMDRRFDIPALGAFQVLASVALMWRLVLDPGLSWLLKTAGPAEVILTLAATLLGPLGALWLTRTLPQTALRRGTGLMVETGLTAMAAIAAVVAIVRLLPDPMGLHGALGLQASVLIALSWVQVRRMSLPFARRFRQVLAWGLGALAGVLCVLAAGPVSPVFGGWLFADRVAGGPILNDLILAYLMPGALLVWLSGWHWLRVAGWALMSVWAGLAIRNLWQGADLRLARGIEEGELYAYTFALLVTGAALLGRAVLTGRADLRKLGLAVIALAAAKAFLMDAAGLGGLLRVGAFLGLGLSLAGLAWVNGWAMGRETAIRTPRSD